RLALRPLPDHQEVSSVDPADAALGRRDRRRSAGRVQQQRTVLTFAAGEAPARRRDGVLEEPGVGPGRLRPAVPAEQVQALCTGVFAERACRRWQADGATAVEVA